MRLKHYSVEKLKKEVIKILEKHLDLIEFKVFFFGSRVVGTGNERSDIDIGIEGKQAIPLEIISKIKDDIEGLNILYKIEIVDFAKVNPDFKKVSIKHVELITQG